MAVLHFVGAALCALLVGTFVEYFVHRSMHWGLLYPEGHRHHHETHEARTFLRDFVDYGTGAVILCWVGFLVSIAAGLGWALGALLYAALASYAHQLQHAAPSLVFWMRRPVHGIHHALDQRDHNFGVLVDWWDRLFGTYHPVEWPRAPETGAARRRAYGRIPWV